MTKTHKGIVYKKTRGEDRLRGPWLGWESEDRRRGLVKLQRVEGGTLDGQLLPENIVYDAAWRDLVEELENEKK